MKRVFVFTLLLALGLGMAYAQAVTTGTLEGVVSDQDGNEISGVLVTAMGPQGVQTTDTDGKGRYSFRGLTPGKYNVKAEKQGFATIVQEGVEVYINRKTQLPFGLNKGVTESVTVTSQAPIVDMKSTTTGAAIKIDDFAPYVPLGRNIVSVFTIAPGVSDGGDPVLGDTNSSISGSSGLENAYFVDGVNITNSGYGGLGAYSIDYGSLGTGVTYDFLEEVQVKTGGFEAEFGQAGGGIVNTVVRAGSNDFGFDVGWYEEPASLEGSRGDREDFPNIANTVDSTRRDISLSAGGPIVKDKLFFFAAYNPITTKQDFKLTSGDATQDYYLTDDATGPAADGFVCDTAFCYNPTDPADPLNGPIGARVADTPQNFAIGQTVSGGRLSSSVTRERSIDNYAGKVSWFASPNHKLEFTAFGDPSTGDVGPQTPTTFLRNLANPNIANPATGATGLDWGGDQLALKYQAVWTSNFFTEVQVSNKKNNFDESGTGTQFRNFFDSRPTVNTTFGGTGFFTTTVDKVDQYSFKNTHVLGPVEFSYGYQHEDIEWAQGRNYSGPGYMSLYPNFEETAFGPRLPAGCTGDPTQAGCYTSILSPTGAAVTIMEDPTPDPNPLTSVDENGDGIFDNDLIYDVTRTDFIPPGDPTTAKETNIFAQGSWDIIPSLTLKAGLRWTEQELVGSGNTTLPICTLSDTTTGGGCSTTLTGQEYKFDSEIAPRVGLTWDVAKNGKHKLYANYGEYYQRIPSDLAVRAFSNEVGVTTEQFFDPDLTMPILNAMCADSGGTLVPCHQSEDVQGLAGGGSIILDGTQQQIDVDGPTADANGDGNPLWDPAPGSVAEALDTNYALTTGAAMALPYTKEQLIGYDIELNDYTGFQIRYINRKLGRTLEDVQFASNEQTQNGFTGITTFGFAGTDYSSFGDVNMDMEVNCLDAEAAVPGIQGVCGPFPGAGTGAFGAYVFGNPGENVNTQLFPTPVRDYDALELVFTRRMHNNWMAYLNYRFAKVRGNFEGSFRNDNSQSDPFLTSLFDFPSMSAIDSAPTVDATTGLGANDGLLDNDFDTFENSPTMEGQFVSGPLNTERRHIFNAFVSRQFDYGLNLGARINVQSGQPRFPLFAHPTYQNSGEIPGFNPVYFLRVNVDTDLLTDTNDGTLTGMPDGILDNDNDGNGLVLSSTPGTVLGDMSMDFNGDSTPDQIVAISRGARLYSYDVVERGFFGRTPTIVTFDVNASYDIDLRGGKSKLTLMLDIFNLFGDNEAIRFDDAVETRPGTANPDFLKANGFQAPRSVRLGAKFSF